MIEGGDKHTPRAKVDIAKREQQIVALKLRGIAAPEIARVIGISRQAVNAAFNKALRRQTEAALDAWHRTELGGLAMEATNIWRLMDLPENKNDWRAQAALEDRLMRIHIRRAKLLGLDAPTKLDVSGIYKRGGDDAAAEQFARDAVLEALPIEEQRRLYDIFYQARLRAAAGDLTHLRGTHRRYL
jgi:DNA-binding CsgD family transcriptional regulator